jgi:hypothetical protein
VSLELKISFFGGVSILVSIGSANGVDIEKRSGQPDYK